MKTLIEFWLLILCTQNASVAKRQRQSSNLIITVYELYVNKD